MPDERVTNILLAKTDLTREEIATLSNGEAWGMVYAAKKPKDTFLRICFTGFSHSQTAKLELLAKNNNMRVVSGVTKVLNFLCTGENPGPVKLKKAALFNVPCITEIQFISLIENGDIPSSA